MMRHLFRLALVVLIGMVLPLGVLRGETPTAAHNRMLEDLKYLASDELEGRGVGTDGLNKAADFVRQEFEKAGLDVTSVDGGAFQKFSIVTGSELGKENRIAFVAPDGKETALEMGKDFTVCSFGGSGKFDTEIVFCGYGIDHEKYNDFDGIELEGKVALILRRNPQQGQKDSLFAAPHGGVSRHAALTTKLSHASRRGAVAVLFVNEPYTQRVELSHLKENLTKAENKLRDLAQKMTAAAEDVDALQKLKMQQLDAEKHVRLLKQQLQSFDADPLMEFGYGGTGKDQSIPVLHISQKVCNRLLEQSLGKDLTAIEREIDETLKPQSQVLKDWQSQGVVTVDRVRSEIKNVIGMLEGTGPLKNETIIVGAHYDHVGRGGAGSLAPGSTEVHNGADDNASGTIALIELARRLAARPEKLSRRIVFIAFTGEEMGLLGSAHYVKEPVFPLENTIAMFNMDMVGRLREHKLTVFGSGTAERWKSVIETAAEDTGLSLVFKPEGFGPSDHSSFYAKKVPVLHLFTNTHRDYHRPSDDWDKVNVPGIGSVVDLLEGIVVATAQEPKRPQYIAIKGTSQPHREGSRPYFGSIPDFATDIAGYALSGVAPGSPADKGGLKAGDVIIRMGDQKIGSLDDFDLALRKFKAGDQVTVVVSRGGKEIPLKVVLATPR